MSLTTADEILDLWARNETPEAKVERRAIEALKKDKSLFYAALPAAIPLNNSSLKGDPLEFWHLESNVSGSRSEVAAVVAAAVALALLITLVPGSLGQLLCLGLQQFIEGFFYAAAYKFLELTLDYFFV